MPHAVVEYSRDLETGFAPQDLMKDLHQCLLDSGQFGAGDIKVRLYPCDHALVAGSNQAFVHTTIYLLSGRTQTVKKDITLAVLKVLQSYKIDAASLSVDCRDLDREVYSKTVE
jgi:5-carboxymethyl-2-hydroxymuconate isomerase